MDLTFINLPTEHFSGRLSPFDPIEGGICPLGMRGQSFIAYYNQDLTRCICAVPSSSITELIDKSIIDLSNIGSLELSEIVTRKWGNYQISKTEMVCHVK